MSQHACLLAVQSPTPLSQWRCGALTGPQARRHPKPFINSSTHRIYRVWRSNGGPCDDTHGAGGSGHSVRVRSAQAPPTTNDELPKEAGFSHVMLAILDSNKGFSTASLQALHTAGDLAAQNRAKLTVMFLDDKDASQLDGKVDKVKSELAGKALQGLDFAEETVAYTEGKSCVALGEAVDAVSADVLVLASAEVHAGRLDANLLAEFVDCPLLLLP
ncbi:hypothetical protein ACKKBG_A12945 [Auxenochlorella protothecoides x Auxenochlorella symbiontica]